MYLFHIFYKVLYIRAYILLKHNLRIVFYSAFCTLQLEHLKRQSLSSSSASLIFKWCDGRRRFFFLLEALITLATTSRLMQY